MIDYSLRSRKYFFVLLVRGEGGFVQTKSILVIDFLIAHYTSVCFLFVIHFPDS